jgi:hypothetical protein
MILNINYLSVSCSYYTNESKSVKAGVPVRRIKTAPLKQGQDVTEIFWETTLNTRYFLKCVGKFNTKCHFQDELRYILHLN